MPEGWVLTDIGELLTNRDSERVPLSLGVRSKQENKIYDYYGATGVVDKVDGYLFDERLLLIGEDGANLLSRSKDNAFFAEGKYWVNNHAHILDCPEKEVLDYVAFLINSMSLEDYITGSAQPKLNQDNLNKIEIPLPPLEEQRRIIAQVNLWQRCLMELETSENELNESVESAKSKILDLAIHGKLVPQDANDEPASELLKRINPKAVASCDNPHYVEPYDLPDGWIWCKLMDLCTFLSRGKSPKYSERDTTYPVFAQKCNLKEGGISLENARFLEPTSINRWPDVYHLQTGDVLVNSTGTGTVGRTRLFNESCLGSYPFVVPDSHVSVVRTHSDIVSEYIFALMSSSWIQAYLENNLAGSTNQKELYIGVLQNVDVPLPPIMEQKRIADKIETLYQQLDGIANHIE